MILIINLQTFHSANCVFVLLFLPKSYLDPALAIQNASSISCFQFQTSERLLQSRNCGAFLRRLLDIVGIFRLDLGQQQLCQFLCVFSFVDRRLRTDDMIAALKNNLL